MQFKKPRFAATAVGAAAMFWAISASASLVYVPGDSALFQGSGLGAVNTVLTLKSPDSSSTETGSVFADGTGIDTSGNALEGTSQFGLPTLGSLGITNIGDLRIILNAAEPSGNSITVTSLSLSFYDATGDMLGALGQFSLASPVTIASTLTGVGQAGFVFALDNDQTLAAATLLGVGDSFAGVRLGLTATLNDATGGPDTFFVGNAAAVPEPETYALMLAGLGAIGFVARRRLR